MKKAVASPTTFSGTSTFYVYRCPECNSWDYSLQSATIDNSCDGEYLCDYCGERFEIGGNE